MVSMYSQRDDSDGALRAGAVQCSGRWCRGVVAESLPKALYRVTCAVEDGKAKRDVVASVSTHMRHVSVKILPGDVVAVELSPYDPNRGRITSRLNAERQL